MSVSTTNATRIGFASPRWHAIALGLGAAAGLALAAPVAARADAAADPRALVDVLFAPSSAELTDAGRAQLARDAQWLREHPDVRVRVVGHSDAVGSVGGNQALGRRRAETVRRGLRELGVASARLRTGSSGAQDPRCMEQSTFCETLWKPGSVQRVSAYSACPKTPDDCFAAERRATLWIVSP